MLLIFPPYQRGHKASFNIHCQIYQAISIDLKCSQCHKTPYFSVPPAVFFKPCSYVFLFFATTLALEVKGLAYFLWCVGPCEICEESLMDCRDVTFFNGSQVQVIRYWDLTGVSM